MPRDQIDHRLRRVSAITRRWALEREKDPTMSFCRLKRK